MTLKQYTRLRYMQCIEWVVLNKEVLRGGEGVVWQSFRAGQVIIFYRSVPLENEAARSFPVTGQGVFYLNYNTFLSIHRT